jgi:hypothetical protein
MFDSNLIQNVFFYQTGGSNCKELKIEDPLLDAVMLKIAHCV